MTADTSAQAPSPGSSSGSGGRFGFLSRKLGPFPLLVWALLAIAGYYLYTKYKAAQSSSSTGASSIVVAAPTSAGGGVIGKNGTRFSSNAEWEVAAINYLVGEQVPPDQASTAIFAFLHSQELSQRQLADVNLAIEGIGPPPQTPRPGGVDRDKKPPKKPKRPGDGGSAAPAAEPAGGSGGSVIPIAGGRPAAPVRKPPTVRHKAPTPRRKAAAA